MVANNYKVLDELKEEGIEEGKILAAKNLLDLLDDTMIASRIGLNIEIVQKLRLDWQDNSK